VSDFSYVRGLENMHLGQDPSLMLEHYPQVYLPAFPGSDKSPCLTHDSNTPLSMSSNDLFYGYDPLINFMPGLDPSMGSFSPSLGAPRIVLSRDSSFFDDWTANNSMISAHTKLPCIAALPSEIEVDHLLNEGPLMGEESFSK
jgi:hypothetical protein